MHSLSSMRYAGPSHLSTKAKACSYQVFSQISCQTCTHAFQDAQHGIEMAQHRVCKPQELNSIRNLGEALKDFCLLLRTWEPVVPVQALSWCPAFLPRNPTMLPAQSNISSLFQLVSHMPTRTHLFLSEQTCKATHQEIWKPAQIIGHGKAALEHKILAVFCSCCLKADLEQDSNQEGCLYQLAAVRILGSVFCVANTVSHCFQNLIFAWNFWYVGESFCFEVLEDESE